MKGWQWAPRLLIGHSVSYDFAAEIGAKPVDNILAILLSRMLAVSTSSLAATVSVYAGATRNIAPRAVGKLMGAMPSVDRVDDVCRSRASRGTMIGRRDRNIDLLAGFDVVRPLAFERAINAAIEFRVPCEILHGDEKLPD